MMEHLSQNVNTENGYQYIIQGGQKNYFKGG